MAISIFDNKISIPNEGKLSEAIKDTFVFWNQIRDFVYEKYPAATELWKYGGEKYGWGFRLNDKKRVIVYLGPGNGYFRVSLVFGEKATLAALNSTISQEVKKIIEASPVYAEGRGIRLEVKNAQLIDDILQLISIKIEH